MGKLTDKFFERPCTEVAEALVGKVLVRRTPEGELRLRISETEAYCGENDTACHAHRGRTKRTEVMYMAAGTLYIYLCYGIHWLMNIVTGEEDQPEAVLIRACVEAPGPGKLTKMLGITGEMNRLKIGETEDFWIEDDGFSCEVKTDKRVGIGYASPEDQERLWRYRMQSAECRMQSAECRMQSAECRVRNAECRMQS